MIGLKVFAIKFGLRLIIKMANKLMDDKKDTPKEVVVDTIKDEVVGLLKQLPNVITDEARRQEQSRRAKEAK